MKPSSIAHVSGLILFLVIWEGSTSSRGDLASLLPAPSTLPRTLAQELSSGRLLDAWGASLSHILLGVSLGGTLGILWGIGVARSPLFAALQASALALLRPIPPIAWIPFAIVWFGSSTRAAAFIVAIGVFWTTLYTTLAAVHAIPESYSELARAFHCTRRIDYLCCILLPGAAPGILGGVRTALGQGWTLIVAAELFGVPGIGQRMWEAAGVLANDVMIIYMFAIALSFTLVDQLFLSIERRLFRWRHS